MSKTVQVVVSDEVYLELVRLAKEDGRSLSSFMRGFFDGKIALPPCDDSGDVEVRKPKIPKTVERKVVKSVSDISGWKPRPDLSKGHQTRGKGKK